jgi:FkbM family methyltransferase
MPISFKDSVARKLRKYGPLRKVYRALVGAEGRERRRKLGNFYKQFIRPDDLVFDIGANIGTYAEAFESIGACVVSVEPNPECAAQIYWTTSRDRVQIVQGAVGDRIGTCKLFVNKLEILSSVSVDWVQKEKETKRREAGMWEKEIEVQMITIDELTRLYGAPHFIKLDVEGFELPALAGMSKQPKYLSFEFHGETLERDIHCFDRLAQETKFDFVINEPFKFEIGQWVSREEAIARIRSAHISTFGDVFARLER